MSIDTTPTAEQTPPVAPDPQAALPTPPPAPTPEVEEVEFDSAKDEATQVEAKKVEDEQEDVLDVIVPKSEPRLWVIGPENVRREYVQRELSFIGKMQWFSLVGDVLDKALSGPNGMSLNSLFSVPGRPGQLSVEDFRDADTFVQALGKLMAVAPDFLVQSYCIWLSVPDYERNMVADMMALPASEGGLSDEMGIEIIETFIVQNYDALADFFGERLSKLGKIVRKKNELRRESQPSKR